MNIAAHIRNADPLLGRHAGGPWDRAKEVSAERGDDLSTILRAALINYISEGTNNEHQ